MPPPVPASAIPAAQPGAAPTPPAGPASGGPAAHIGCTPGDWHPSNITEDTLKQLICCAWDYAKKKKAEAQEAAAAVQTATQNLEAIKKIILDDKGLDDKIKSELTKVTCVPAGK